MSRRAILVGGLGAGLVIAAGLGLLILLANRDARLPAPAFTQIAELGDLRVTLQLDGSAVGTRVVDLLIRDAAGQPVAVRAVRLQFTMAEMDMGIVEADAQPVDVGTSARRGHSSAWPARGP